MEEAAGHNVQGQLTARQCISLAHVEEHFQPHAEGTEAHLAAPISARPNHTMKRMLVPLLENLQKMEGMTQLFQIAVDNNVRNCKWILLTGGTAKNIPHSMKKRIAVINRSFFKHFRCSLINWMVSILNIHAVYFLSNTTRRTSIIS